MLFRLIMVACLLLSIYFGQLVYAQVDPVPNISGAETTQENVADTASETAEDDVTDEVLKALSRLREAPREAAINLGQLVDAQADPVPNISCAETTLENVAETASETAEDDATDEVLKALSELRETIDFHRNYTHSSEIRMPSEKWTVDTEKNTSIDGEDAKKNSPSAVKAAQ